MTPSLEIAGDRSLNQIHTCWRANFVFLLVAVVVKQSYRVVESVPVDICDPVLKLSVAERFLAGSSSGV